MSESIRWMSATSVDDLWEGDLIDVEVAGEPVMLVHLLDGKIKAYQGMCPHQEILLADGKWDADRNILLCHGHNWEFDLANGHGLNPTGCRLFCVPEPVRPRRQDRDPADDPIRSPHDDPSSGGSPGR